MIKLFTDLRGARGGAFACAAMALASCASLDVETLSSRPDMVSGGGALVSVSGEAFDPQAVTVTLNGEDVTDQLSLAESGDALVGVVSGFEVGDNVLRARGAGRGALRVTNYPITGPILSGPHLDPYECRTVESGLGEPLNDDCSAMRRVDYFYRTTDGEFAPLEDPADRPRDLAETTTIDGVTVPYIVQVESGTINRTIYRIATLAEPGGWNGRLGVTFGGGAGTNYNQGTNQVESILNDLYLSRGFAFMNATELVNGLHANAVLQGETLMMLKEHFIENYGVPKWTVGTGGSGGAIQQQLITQMMPGLLDGLQPSLAYPDSTLHTADCGLLQNYWRNAEDLDWTDEKKQAVQGYSFNTCEAWERSFVPVNMAMTGCGLTDESLQYDPETNPTGARCTVTDMRANIYGRDPETGFGRRPLDNIGLQYGLGALNDGVISVDEFLDMNARIGGLDSDGNYVTERHEADPIALEAVYRSGLLNSFGGGIANVPIINYRVYLDERGDIHSRERDLTIRARIENANGRSDNQVIWVAGAGEGGFGALGPVAAHALDVMTEWLDNIAADPAPLSTDTVVANKPAEAVDAYWNEDGEKVAEVASWDNSTGYNQTYPVHLEPRLVAGAPPANDILKCQLKPIDYADYAVDFSADQMAQLEEIFPDGVCDFSVPGVSQQPIAGTYQRY
ncbi:MAG: DUF6351 family protein [Maricaulaceae bacterium]|jgi:hypothetical protein